MTTDPPVLAIGQPCDRAQRIACPCNKHEDTPRFFELWCARYVALLEPADRDRVGPPAHILELAEGLQQP